MNTNTPEKCPKCGLDVRFKTASMVEFQCRSVWTLGGRFHETVICVEHQRDQLAERVKELEAALDLVIPNCDYLHHGKKHRHLSHEPCPVREIVMKAKGLK